MDAHIDRLAERESFHTRANNAVAADAGQPADRLHASHTASHLSGAAAREADAHNTLREFRTSASPAPGTPAEVAPK
jgi:hypothetical protein